MVLTVSSIDGTLVFSLIIGFKDAFYKYTWDEADVQGFKYDLTSIMHYENSAFTNGYCRPTMLVKNDYSYEVTPVYLRKFSPQDIQKINKLYNCQTTQLPPTGKLRSFDLQHLLQYNVHCLVSQYTNVILSLVIGYFPALSLFQHFIVSCSYILTV